jgi:transposase-like protein
MVEKLLLKFPGQLHAFRKTTLGDNLITFTVDRAYSEQIVDIIKKEIGTEFVVYLEDVTSETNLEEDPKELKERLFSKLHGLLGRLSEISGRTKEQEKTSLKKELIRKEMIKESTTELNIKGLVVACNIVEEMINANK